MPGIVDKIKAINKVVATILGILTVAATAAVGWWDQVVQWWAQIKAALAGLGAVMFLVAHWPQIKAALTGLVAVLLVVGVLASTGCQALSQAATPDQEEVAKSVEGKALTKAGTFANTVAQNLDKLASKAVLEPIDPTQPMVITNGRLVVTFVDSSVPEMVRLLGEDFTKYKSPPGFWSFAINTTDRIFGAVDRWFPWFAMYKVATDSGRGSTHYDHSFNENQNSPMAVQNGYGWTMNTSFDQSTHESPVVVPPTVIQPVIVAPSGTEE